MANTPTLAHFYLAVCLRWARVCPPGSSLITGAGLPPRLAMLLGAVERRPAVMPACAAEFFGGTPFTAPSLPAFSRNQVAG